MKKWFTLLAMALMAVGANAQDQTVLDNDLPVVIDETNLQMLRNGASWIYTMFSPSLYQFYEEQGGLTHLASKEVEYRVYDVQESDGRTNYLVKEEVLLPGTRGMNSTRAYQGNYLALREEGGQSDGRL